LLLPALLLTSCASKLSPVVLNARKINDSALYDPPTVHLIDGEIYQFKEGALPGKGQAFHSHYSYMRAVIIGDK
jgi:hypothetical protein